MMIQAQYFQPLLQAKIYSNFVLRNGPSVRHRGKLTKILNACFQRGIITAAKKVVSRRRFEQNAQEAKRSKTHKYLFW